jgi:hypothetical protein
MCDGECLMLRADNHSKKNEDRCKIVKDYCVENACAYDEY